MIQVVCQSLGTNGITNGEWEASWAIYHKILVYSIILLTPLSLLIALHKISHSQPLLSSQSFSSYFSDLQMTFKGEHCIFPLFSTTPALNTSDIRCLGIFLRADNSPFLYNLPTECSTIQLTVNWTQCGRIQKICSFDE